VEQFEPVEILKTGDDVRADYEAVSRSAGVRVIAERKIVRVVGDDRVSFFHGMCSADIKGAKSGAIVPALILTEHAHVIADLFIWVTDDALLLDIEREAWTRARATLERLLVADDVEFEESDELSIIDVEGPAAADVVGAFGASAQAGIGQWRFATVGDLKIGNLPRFGGDAISILAKPEQIDSTVEKILAAISSARIVQAEALEIIRVENGVPRAGMDTTDKTIALEARLNRAISFNKGCYLGQETIERATARGALKKKLFGLRFEGRIVPPHGAALSLGGKEIGRVGSAVLSPRLGAIGLAILHHSAWMPGLELAVAGGQHARVSDLPFARD
jgi:folate-binding protein YgfZ